MRQRLLVSLTLLVVAAAISAAVMRQRLLVRPRLPGWPRAVGAVKPIPQDTARMEQRSRDRLEWSRRTLQGSYEKAGKKDPRWDQPAREALDRAARMFSFQVDPVVAPKDVHVPAKKAVDAGCDDPLILYLYARTSVGKDHPGDEESDRRLQVAADAMSTSAHSPYRRAVALRMEVERRTGKPNLSADERRAVERKLDAILDLLPKSVAEDPRNEDWEAGWYETINQVVAMHRQLGGDYKAAFDRVDVQLAKVSGIEPLRLTVKGYFLLMWGWEARTNAFAFAVAEPQLRSFEGRLQAAGEALEEAWRLKAGEPHVATIMLDVEKGIGGGDREAMETWFERAMNSNPNDETACLTKLDWLDPKWYGGDSPDQMMAFGKACAATKNWQAGITLLAADAHLSYRGLLERDKQMAYMRSPEVWSDIKSVYDEYLEHYPDDNVARSKYAMLCWLGAHYPKAHAQFQALGDRLTTWPHFPNFPLESMKGAREHTAKVIASRPRGKARPAPKGNAPGPTIE